MKQRAPKVGKDTEQNFNQTMTQAATNLHGTSSRRLQVPAYHGRGLSVIIPISLVAGLSLGIAVFSAGGSHEAPTPAAPPQRPADLQVIYTPARSIPAGARIERADFRQMVVHKSEIPEDSFEDINSLFGQYAKVELEAGRTVRKASVSRIPTFKTLLSSIPVGFRGITLAVDSTGAIENWAKPGAHVDVIVSYFDKKSSKKTTLTAVEDAVVISFNGLTTDMIEAAQNQGVNPQAQMGVPQSATVTLAAPLKDALRIQTAKMMGTLSLVLRNPNDNIPSRKKVATPEDLRKMLPGARSPVVVPVAAPRAAPPPPVANPDGFARYRRRDGSMVEMELWGPEWKKSQDATNEGE